ncbi:MAG: nucleotidyl transferase AbiEii/AbiGii toxin family protein [Tagaea sp.]|nr:nucleotidyl transferase AbiEii/AbiGii toxin family protein [Tagaea sp.]
MRPRLKILPPAQRRLWPALAPVAKDFVLYGGTAVALHLGHRQSVDFDFFSSKPVDSDALIGRQPRLARGKTVQNAHDTWSVVIDGVKLSFFGGLKTGRVERPDVSDDGVLRIAGLRDLLARKLFVLQKRVDPKDYLDIAAMLDAGLDLPQGLADARAIHGPERAHAISIVKGLSDVANAELRRALSDRVKRLLLTACEDFARNPGLPKSRLQAKTLDA